MKTHKFARRPFYVDAVRVSEANLKEVAEWCGGEVLSIGDAGRAEEETPYIKVQVHRPLTERQTQAFVGDWVLFAGSGYKVYTPKAFDKSFEKVKTLTKAQADEAGIKVPHEPRPPKKPLSKNQAVTNVGQAIREASKNAVKKPPVPTPPKSQGDIHKPFKISTVVNESSITKEDVEADKLIQEVLRDQK